jgi:hypothetical protein
MKQSPSSASPTFGTGIGPLLEWKSSTRHRTLTLYWSQVVLTEQQYELAVDGYNQRAKQSPSRIMQWAIPLIWSPKDRSRVALGLMNHSSPESAVLRRWKRMYGRDHLWLAGEMSVAPYAPANRITAPCTWFIHMTAWDKRVPKTITPVLQSLRSSLGLHAYRWMVVSIILSGSYYPINKLANMPNIVRLGNRKNIDDGTYAILSRVIHEMLQGIDVSCQSRLSQGKVFHTVGCNKNNAAAIWNHYYNLQASAFRDITIPVNYRAKWCVKWLISYMWAASGHTNDLAWDDTMRKRRVEWVSPMRVPITELSQPVSKRKLSSVMYLMTGEAARDIQQKRAKVDQVAKRLDDFFSK